MEREALPYLLRRLYARSEALFAQEMVPDGLTPRQFTLLVASYKRPGGTVSELAGDIAVDVNTTSAMVRRTIEKGLLERRRSEQDQRAWLVDVTPAGAELIRQALPGNDRLSAAIMEPLPPEYRPLFIKSLRLMLGLEEA